MNGQVNIYQGHYKHPLFLAMSRDVSLFLFCLFLTVNTPRKAIPELNTRTHTYIHLI